VSKLKNKMKAAVLHAPADLRVENIEVPNNLEDNEVLVRVKAAGVCGSDLERVMRSGTYSFPTIPGHEFSGEVVKTGKYVSNFKEHDRVVVAPMIPCFECDMCQGGYYGQCRGYNFLGSRTDGGFAEYVKAPSRNLIKMPDSVSFLEGAAVEPAAVTLHGMRKVKIEPGDSVAVLGCGAIGMFAIQFAKIMGATRVIAVDVETEKLQLAKKMGADTCINATECDPVESIRKDTQHMGVNVSIETAGVSATQEQCLRITKEQGRVLYLGTAHKDVVIPPKSFECIVRKELEIVGAWNSYSAPFPGVEWSAVLDYINDGRLKIKPLISHVFKLEEAPDVFNDLFGRKYVFNKVIFEID
jgi:L-iditol 2-dehydrogenase